MKLHLPQSLRTALLACVCVVSISTSWGDVVLKNSVLQTDDVTNTEGQYTYEANGKETATSVNFSPMASDSSSDTNYDITLKATGDNSLTITYTSSDGIASPGESHWNYNADMLASDLTLDGNVSMTMTNAGIRLTEKGSHTLTITNGAYLSLRGVWGAGDIDVSNGGVLVTGQSDTAALMGHKGTLTLKLSDATSKLILNGNVSNNYNNSEAVGTMNLELKGGTVGAMRDVTFTGTSTNVSGAVTFQTSKYSQASDGTLSVSDTEGITVALNAVTIAAAGNMTTSGLGTVTMASLTNNGTLTIGANTTLTSYDTSSTGTIKVADEKTLTITDTTSYTSNHRDDTSKASNLWSLLTAADASSTGNGGKVILGDASSAGSTTFLGDGNYKYDATKAPQTIKGHYVLNGSVTMNRWAAATTSTIASTGSLEVAKGAYFASRQEWNVQGALTVGETLSFGYSGREDSTTGAGDNQYYGRLNIDGGTVTANQLQFNTGTDTSNTSGLTLSNGGSLILGSGGLTAGSGKVPTIVLSYGTLGVKEGATSWSSSLDMTLGGVAGNSLTIDSGATITLGGAVTFNGTVTNKGHLSLTGTLLVDEYANMTVTGGEYSDAENGNGFHSGNYWLVQGQETTSGDTTVTPSLTLSATTATVTGITDPVNVTLDGNGGAYMTLTGTVYEVNNGTVAFSTAKEGATGVHVNGGTLSFAETDRYFDSNGEDNTYTSWDVNNSADVEKNRLPVMVVKNSGIHLNEGAQVDAKFLTVEGDSKITLTGSGTYRLGVDSYDADVAELDLAALKDSTKWTGTISTTDRDTWGAGTRLSGQDLSLLGNANSTIELRGTWGYFKDGTIDSNIKLTNTTNWDALRFEALDPTKSEHNFTFTGDVSGTGDFVRTASGTSANGDTMNVSFSGDVSGWSGGFTIKDDNDNSVKGVTNVTFSNEAMEIQTKFSNETTDHTLNIIFDNSDADQAMVFDGTVSGTGKTNMSIEAGTVALGSSSTDSNAIANGQIEVKSGATLELNHGAADVSQTKLVLGGADLHVKEIGSAGSGTIQFGELNVTDSSDIIGGYGGTLKFSSLTGKGNLNLSHATTTNGWNRNTTVSLATAAHEGTLTVGKRSVVNVDGGSLNNVEITGIHGDATEGKTDDAAVESSLTLNNGTAVKGTLTIGSSSDAAVTITGKTDAGATFSGVTLRNVKDSGAEISGGTLSGASVTVDKAFALSGVTLSDCSFNINAALQMDSATSLSNTALNIGATGALVGDGSLALSGSHQLSLSLSAGAELTLGSEGLTYMTLVSNQLQGLSGSSDAAFTLDMVNAQAALSALLAGVDASTTGLAIIFSNTQNAAMGVDDDLTEPSKSMSFTLSSGLSSAIEGLGYTVNESLTASGAGNGQVVVYLTKANGDSTTAIPEPTTATLSLLALAALCARRRRSAK